MSSASLTKNSVLIRGLGVTTRVVEQATDTFEGIDGGALLETMLGRYVLDRDGVAIWHLLDGRRTIDQIVQALAAAEGVPSEQLGRPVANFCERLLQLRLAEQSDDAAQKHQRPAVEEIAGSSCH